MLIGAKDIIAKSVALYRDNAQLFLTYMAALFIPTVTLSIIGVFTDSGSQPGAASTLPSGPIVALVLVLAIVFGLAYLWITIGFVRTLAARYEGRDAGTLNDGLRASVRLIWPMILISILVALIVIAGFILLIIPGILFGIWFVFSAYAVLLDNHKVIESLKVSRNLVKGRWWGVLWRLLAPGVVFGILAVIVEYVPSVIGYTGLAQSTAGNIALVMASSALSLLVIPLTTAAPTILYLELKKNPVTASAPSATPQP